MTLPSDRVSSSPAIMLRAATYQARTLVTYAPQALEDEETSKLFTAVVNAHCDSSMSMLPCEVEPAGQRLQEQPPLLAFGAGDRDGSAVRCDTGQVGGDVGRADAAVPAALKEP